MYELINTSGLPGTGYIFPYLPLLQSISPNYYVTIDNPVIKTFLNEIDFIFDPLSVQNSFHTNNKDNPKSKITHIKMNPDEIEDLEGDSPAATLLGREKKHFTSIQSEGTLLCESSIAHFRSGSFFIPFISSPTSINSAYSHGTTGRATVDYMISFTDAGDSTCPFTVSSSSIPATSHRTNAPTSTQNSFRSPKTLFELTIFSLSASRNSSPSSNSSSLNISFADIRQYSHIIFSYAHQRSPSFPLDIITPQIQTSN